MHLRATNHVIVYIYIYIYIYIYSVIIIIFATLNQVSNQNILLAITMILHHALGDIYQPKLIYD